jgi:hypothetical protein
MSYSKLRRKFCKTNDSRLYLKGLYTILNTQNKEFKMARVSEIGDYGRIEDFITLAKEGKEVNLGIKLKKQLVTQKVHPEDTEDMKNEVDIYLLTADYFFKVGKDLKLVSKVYMFGTSEESPNALKVSKSIANERLKMDYRRLKDAKITFEEKYF